MGNKSKKLVGVGDAENGVARKLSVESLELTAPLLWSARLSIFVIFLFGTCNMVLQRFNVNFALVCMHRPMEVPIPSENFTSTEVMFVNDTNIQIFSEGVPFIKDIEDITLIEETISSGNACPTRSMKRRDTKNGSRQFTSEFSWTKDEQGSIIASFYWGLAIAQIPSAFFVDRFGAARSVLLSQFLLSILSMINPIVAKLLGSQALFLVRFLMGVANAPALPSINVLAARWCGSMERSFLIGILAVGFSLATAIVYPISAFFCQNMGWEGTFYFAGATGILWSIIACFIIFEWPECHPRISGTELKFIQKYRAVQPESSKKKLKTPWMKIFLSLPVWAIFIANFSCFWSFLTVGAYLPTYLNEVLQLNISSNGFLSACPFIGMMSFHFFVAILFDWLRRKKVTSLTTLRKIFNSIGMLGASLSLALLGLVPCDSLFGNILLFSLSQTIQEMAWMGGYLLSVFEVGPRYTSILTALNNIFAYLSGFGSPAFVAWMTSEGTREQWLNVFYLAAGINVFGAVFYLIFGDSTLQSWAAVPVTGNDQRDIAKEQECLNLGDAKEVEMKDLKISLISVGDKDGEEKGV